MAAGHHRPDRLSTSFVHEAKSTAHPLQRTAPTKTSLRQILSLHDRNILGRKRSRPKRNPVPVSRAGYRRTRAIVKMTRSDIPENIQSVTPGSEHVHRFFQARTSSGTSTRSSLCRNSSRLKAPSASASASRIAASASASRIAASAFSAGARLIDLQRPAAKVRAV